MKKVLKLIPMVCINLIILSDFSCQRALIKSTIKNPNSLAFFKNDTSAYLNNIMKHKDVYIGKPISYLIQDIEFPIATFSTTFTPDNEYCLLISLNSGDGIFHPKETRIPKQMIIDIFPNQWISIDSINAIRMENGPQQSRKWSVKTNNYLGKFIVGGFLRITP